MTKHECNEKISELNKKIKALYSEKKVYENYIYEENIKWEIAEHKALEGKCFITRGLKNNKNFHVKAFKVITVLEKPNTRYAECLAVIDETTNIARKSIGISKTVLPIWSYNQLSIKSGIEGNRMIDFYSEISYEEFDSIVQSYADMILK